ncbi:MAG: hypothetical protein RL377_326 [Bacteroidota bacterium]
MMQRFIFFILLFLLLHSTVQAQSVLVSGTVYDISGRRPVEAVIVHTNNNMSTTDSLGRYIINVKANDSIWFSLFGKNTQKYTLDTIEDKRNFNIMIHVNGIDLPEVRVRNNNYRLDSMQNRYDYAKYFNYQPPGLKLANNSTLINPSGGLSIGFDLVEMINMFRFKRNRNLGFLQKRLISQEQEKYINYRFTKRFVQKITHLEGDNLVQFMDYCKPSYEVLGLLNDLELGYYIQQKYLAFKTSRP